MGSGQEMGTQVCVWVLLFFSGCVFRFSVYVLECVSLLSVSLFVYVCMCVCAGGRRRKPLRQH